LAQVWKKGEDLRHWRAYTPILRRRLTVPDFG